MFWQWKYRLKIPLNRDSYKPTLFESKNNKIEFLSSDVVPVTVDNLQLYE